MDVAGGTARRRQESTHPVTEAIAIVAIAAVVTRVIWALGNILKE